MDRLRRFRNAAFHFQRDYLDARHIELMKPEPTESAQWTRGLTAALSAFFMDWFDAQENADL